MTPSRGTFLEHHHHSEVHVCEKHTRKEATTPQAKDYIPLYLYRHILSNFARCSCIISDSTRTQQQQDNTRQHSLRRQKRKDYTMSRTKRIIEEVNSIHHDYVAVVTPEKKKQRRFKEEPLEEVKSHKEEKDDDDRKIAPNVKEESQLDEEKDNDDDGDDRKIAPNIKEESQRGEEKDNDDDRKMAPYVKEESLLNEGRIIKEVNNIHHDYAAVVTPERNPNPNSIHEEKDDDNDRKMAPNEKEESQADEGLIDGDTIMGFPLHPNLTNRQILLGHYAFVTWARRQTEPRGRLIPFLEWCDSDEARALELEGRGNQKFTFGMYDGKAFYQIYKEDPTYHIRYTFMLRKARKEAPGTLIRYIAWISDYEKSM